MLRYVKICPRCGRHNDEFSEACDQDGEFLGMVPATPADSAPPEPVLKPTQPPQQVKPADAPQTEVAPESEQEPVTSRLEEVRHRLYLEVQPSGQCYEVSNGDIVGQAHPTSPAKVQLENVPGVNYVHRNHCSFEYRDNRWHVTAIAQQSYTNPTFVNQQRLGPGQSAPLSNGDRLMLSNVPLHVRVVEMP